MQVKKDAMEQAIVRSAGALLAEGGMRAVSMARVAQRAGCATGNVYRYFGNKQALLDAVVPPAFPVELLAAVRAQVRALGAARDTGGLPRHHPYHAARAALSRLVAPRRHAVMYLLGGFDGPHAGFTADLAAAMVEEAAAYTRQAWPRVELDSARSATLARLYDGYVRSLGRALQAMPNVPLEEATRDVHAYHVAGLQGLLAQWEAPCG